MRSSRTRRNRPLPLQLDHQQLAITTLPISIGAKRISNFHTENTDCTTALNEYSHRSDVPLGQGVLHSGRKETNPTSERGRLQRGGNGILRVVAVLLFVLRGHGVLNEGVWRGDWLLVCVLKPPMIEWNLEGPFCRQTPPAVSCWGSSMALLDDLLFMCLCLFFRNNTDILSLG